MSRTFRRLLATVIVLGALVALGWHVTRPEPVTVLARRVERGRVEATVANTRSGTVKACRRAQLAPAPRAGRHVTAPPVREGERVKKGDVLLALWNEDLVAQLKLAQSEAVAAQAKAEEACRLATLAKKEADRVEKLHRQGITTDERVEQAVADAEAKAASCRAAEAAAKVSESGISVAKSALERTVLKAPFDGIVAELNAELGEVIIPLPPGIPTPPAVDLIEEGCLYVRAPLDEVDAPRVRLDMEVRVTLDAFPGKKFEGRVQRIAPFVLDREKEARTVDIDVVFVDPEDAACLLPGYSADVEVLLESREEVLRVPADAVLEGSRVLVYRDGKLEERKIETGIWNWRSKEVISGLQEGDLVVTSIGREGVRAGAKAVLEEPQTAPAAPADDRAE